ECFQRNTLGFLGSAFPAPILGTHIVNPLGTLQIIVFMGLRQVPVWHSAVDTNMTGHEHIRWRGAERGLAGGPGHGHVAAGRGGMAGQGSFAHGGHSQGYIVPSGRLEGGGMASQDQGGRVPNPHPHPHFTRRY
ncbi:scaffold attachment factor B2, isoform CRA_c, partial [Mus musculus]